MIGLEGRLLFALPKKGRLCEKSERLVEKAGFTFRRDSRSDIALCENMNSALIFLPAKDIPYFLAQGNVDLGITGQDVLLEADWEGSGELELGFGKCRLCLLCPEEKEIDFRSDFPESIVTSFPSLTERFFRERFGKCPKIIGISGSVEISCMLGLAEMVVDLVQTGETIEKAGLKIAAEMMVSEAVLAVNPHTEQKESVARVRRRINGILTAEKYAIIEYNILKRDLKKGEAITPGKRSPTVMPLEDSEWLAVKAMIRKPSANRLIEELEGVGAKDILVYHIENCGSV